MRTLVIFLALAGIAAAQYEAGFVKILHDKRYQDGAAFGNYREQEDGIKYQEESDASGVRRGFWEYPSPDGQLLRVEFEAGPGIGFRITNSNYLSPTPIAAVNPQFQPAPAPVPAPAPAPIPAPTPRPHTPHSFHVPTTTPYPGPINLFDYPANLEFSRHAQGHRFKFSAL